MQGKIRSAKDRYSAKTAPASLSEAYKIVLQSLNWKPAAWKLGNTTKTSQTALENTVPFFGPLAAWEVANSPATLEIDKDLKVCGELELLLKLGDADNSSSSPFDAWAWGFELPSPSITNLADLPLSALIMDRCGAFFLVIGQTYSINESREGLVRFMMDGKEAARASLDVLANSPEDCARQFLEEAKQNGFKPEAGQWIATGGLTKCVPITSGKAEIIWNDKPVCQLTVIRK